MTGAASDGRPAKGAGAVGRLPRSFFARPASEVGPELLGLVFVVGDCRLRIVEVEAYEPDDPASHSFIGVRPRNAVMFGPPGHLYIYRSYGLHWCANVVCGPVGVGAAVLLRAGEPTAGVAAMRARRPKVGTDEQLCSGPGKLCAALGLSGAENGADLLDRRSTIRLGPPPPPRERRDAGTDADAQPGSAWWVPPSATVVCTTRIGLSKAVEQPWRWYESTSRHVSRRSLRPGPATSSGERGERGDERAR